MPLWLKAVTVGILAGLLGVILGISPFGLGLEENLGLDLLFRLRGVREVPQDVLIVTLDRHSAADLNLSTDPDDWPRSLHAQLINNLIKNGAAVIAFDMLFDEPGQKEDDQPYNIGGYCIKITVFTFTKE